MATALMATFDVWLHAASSGVVQMFLVEADLAGNHTVKAHTAVQSRDTALGRFKDMAAEPFSDLQDKVRNLGTTLVALEDLPDDDPLTLFAAFRGTDARSSILDAAYTYLTMKVVPLYDQGSLQVQNDVFSVMGDGLALNPTAGRAAPKDPKNKPRPKAKAKLTLGWF